VRFFRLFGFLWQTSRLVVVLMVGTGALAGLFSAGVLAIVSDALHRSADLPVQLLLAFGGLAAGKILATGACQLLMVRFSQGTILDLSLNLCARIVRGPLRLLEQRGSAQILVTLTDDVSSVTWAVQCLPQLAMNGAMLVGCSLYLAWLSWPFFLGAASVTLFGGLVAKVLHDRAFRIILAARDARARLFEHFRSLTGGLKELMMHRGRREALVGEKIRAAADDYRRSNLTATTHYTLAEAWMQGLYHGLIGLLLFAFPLITRPSPEALTAYVFAMVYMMAPLWTIIGSVPALARGQVALDKIEALGVFLDSPDVAGAPVDGAEPADGELLIRMKQVVFAYDRTDPTTAAFSLGPLDFRLRAGELVFVAGGNGSGKSTFLKVLTGLYPPQQGEIWLGDTRVSDRTREWYREHFSVVFADCFVFDTLLGLSGPHLEVAASHYLQLLQLDHRVRLRSGEFSTTALSHGQRKRLALLTAYLEDRPFYIFDEWAAEQDPQYKDVFYSKLLPELRQRGKGIVVITHDDRYFHLSDRILKLEDGGVQPDS
jgi:putative pyoverdin transport system ATP-binding/permease protein